MRIFFHQFNRLYQGVLSRFRNAYYRFLGVNIQGYVWMRSIEIPRNWNDITLEEGVSLDRGVVLLCSGPHRKDKLIIRSGTYVNRYTMLDAHEHLEIGRNCMIGPHCYFTDANHGVAMGQFIREQPMQTSPVIIGDDVWIGAGVIVLPGVHIGRGAVVGAGSVVTSDIPSNTIAVGVPARVLRTRE